MDKTYTELERMLNIIARAAKEFGLEIDGVYSEACDLIDAHGIDYYVTDDDNYLSVDHNNVSWSDGMGFEFTASGQFDWDTTYRYDKNTGKCERIENFEAESGRDYHMVHTDIDSEGMNVGFLVKIKE